MAKYSITRTCGHVETVQIYGKVSGRESTANYEATKLCADCYRAKLEADRKAASEQAAQQASAQGLAKLTGSEKQIAWAETIRAKAMPQLAQLRALLKVPTQTAGQDAHATYNLALTIIAAIEQRTAAKDWIETRGKDFSTGWLVNELTHRAAQLNEVTK